MGRNGRTQRGQSQTRDEPGPGSLQGLQRLLWLSDVAGAARLFRWWGKVGMSSGSQAVGRGCQHWGV